MGENTPSQNLGLAGLRDMIDIQVFEFTYFNGHRRQT
jgi:hypothetical protein